MSFVIALNGNSISDCVENGTGDITNWNAILNENDFSEWCPNLYNGQIIQIPASANLNLGNIATLQTYPANNNSVPDIFEQIDSIFGILTGASAGFVPDFQPPIIDTNVYYFVRNGEQITDIISNSTGDITNWDAICGANNFDWDELLFAGQKITIPNGVTMNLNNYRGLNTYPANNNSVPDIYEQLFAIFDLMINPIPPDWILSNPQGQWNDVNHFWRDTAEWYDAP